MSRKRIRKQSKMVDQPIDRTNDAETFFSAPDFGDMPVFASVCPINGDEEGYLRYFKLYMRAHELIRPAEEFPSEGFIAPGCVGDALRTLRTVEHADEDELLEALGVLGHTPSAISLKALSTFYESDHPLAPVAAFAMEECAGLCSQFGDQYLS